MNKKKFEISYSLLFVIALLVLILWAGINILQEEKEPELINVSVILEDSNNSRWSSLKLGLETAAKEQYVDLSFISTPVFSDVNEQRSLINQKVEDGAAGIIINPYDDTGMDDFYEPLSWNVSLGFVITDVEKGESKDSIIRAVPNYEELAEKLLEQIREDYGQNLSGKKVHFYSKHAHEQSVLAIMRYVSDSLRNDGSDICGIAYNIEKQKQLLDKTNSIDIIVAFDDDTLQTTAKELSADSKNNINLYGIGNSESSIYYLDKGIINGMIISDDFNLGYECMTAVAKSIRNKYEEKDEIKVTSFSVRSDDVHDKELEKILFPVIQ